MNKTLTKAISLILCVAMVLSFDCTGITTALAAASDTVQSAVNVEDDVTGVTDVTDASNEEPQDSALTSLIDTEGYLTDEGLQSLQYLPYDEEKHTEIIDNGDGTSTLNIYLEPIKYETEEGEYEYIDNTLTETSPDSSSEDIFENVASDVEVQMSDNLNQSDAIQVTYEDYNIAFKPLDILTQSGESSADLSFVETETETVEENIDAVEECESVVYSETFNEDTDIVITPTSTGLKENIILNGIPVETEFSYEFTVENVIPLLREDGNLYFVDIQKGLLVAAIASPFMYDSAEEYVESYDIEVKLEQTGENTYKYTIKPDRTFLEAETTVYPVTIDPSINTLSSGTIADTFVAQRYSGNNYVNDAHLKIGNSSTFKVSRGLIKLTSLPGELDGNTILKAEYHGYQDYSGASYPSMEVHQITEDWDASIVTWTNQPDFDPEVLDAQTVQAISEYSWDITSLAQDWASGYADSFGICIKICNETLNQYKRFCSSESATNKNHFEFIYATAPSVSVSPSTWSNNVTVSWSGISTESNFNVQYATSDSAETPDDSDFVTINNTYNVASGTASLSLPDDAPMYVFVRALYENDVAGPAGGCAYYLDITSPDADISTPFDGDSVKGTVTITGTASDTNLNNWVLEYGSGEAPSSWTQINSGTSEVLDGTLGNWNTASLLSTVAYSVRVRVTDLAGNTTTSPMVCVSIDRTPPTAPAGLSCTSVSDTTISLEWEESTDNVEVTEYYIYRGWAHVGSTSDTAYTDTGLEIGTEYRYYVVAKDLAGNLSSASIEVSVTTTNSFSYIVNEDNTISITGYSESDAIVTIPTTIEDKTVTRIGDSAFYNNNYITSVTIPDSVTSIGNRAFDDCDNLISASIPNSVTTIGDYAFYWCKKLTSLTIPSSVTNIGSNAFFNCTGLTSITILSGVTTIEDYAFGYCTGITSLSIPNSVTSIGDYAFQNCVNLTTVYLSNSMTNTGDYSFYWCTKLTSITIPSSVTSIGSYSFYWCTKLTSVTIPSSVTSIGEYAFSYSGLASITLPNVASIGNYAFYHCSSLTRTTMQNNVTSIGNHAFDYCIKLANITMPSSVTSIGSHAFYYCSLLTSITIPSSVTSIGEYAFSNCIALTSITIPSSVTSIANGTFQSCSKLTGIIIPSSVTSIGDRAFQSCSGLTSITIPGNVTSIGNYVFQYCSGLTSITIPNNITSIGDYAFYSCSGLTSITIPSSVTSIGRNAFTSCSGATSLMIPSSITSIGVSTFSSCSKLTNVTIPSSVTSIGYAAFSGCSGLTSITIPSSVINIGDYAFQSCSKLTSVTIPNGVTSIGNYTFRYCSLLTSITIPNSVTSIGDYAFYSCIGFTNIPIMNNVTSLGKYAFYGCTGLTSITIPSTVTEIRDRVFQNCTGLTSIMIPSSVTSIGACTFLNCTGLTSITMQNSATSIGTNAFYGCTGLTSITIPSSVTSIGDYAFKNCTNLTNVTMYSSTSLGTGVFDGCTSVTVVANDITPPTTPISFTVTPVSWDSSVITLAISGSTDAHSGLQKYEYSTTSATSGFADVPTDGQITLTSGNTVVYARAVDNSGNTSVVVSTSVKPVAISSLSVRSNVNYTVQLKWAASATSGAKYNIYRSNAGTTELVASNIETLYWNDYNLNYGVTYYYSVKAVKEYVGAAVESTAVFGPAATIVSSDEVNKKVGKKDYEEFVEFSTQSGNGYINPASGNLLYETTDLTMDSPIGALEFVRSYNSQTLYSTPLGQGWDFNYNIILLKEYDANQAETGMILKLGNGNMYRFAYNSQTGTYTHPNGLYATLALDSMTGKFSLTFMDKTVYRFNLNNQIERITDRNGNWLEFSYNDVVGLESVVDNVGNEMTITYSTVTGEGGLIKTVTGNGKTYTYLYTDGMLSQVYVTNGTQQIGEQYTYISGVLTTIKNPNGNDYKIAYNNYTDKKVTSVTNPLNQATTLAYSTDTIGLVVTTQSNHVMRQYWYDSTTLVLKQTQFESESSTGLEYDSDFNLLEIEYPDNSQESYTYNANGTVSTFTDKLGHVTTYLYGDPDNLDLPTQVTEPFNGSDTKVTVYEYDAYGNLTSESVQGINQVTSCTYDTYGNVNLQTVTITDGSSTYTSTTDYDYDTKGRLIKITLPDSTYTEQTYDTYGNVETETDAKGIVTKHYYNVISQQTQQTSAYGTTSAISIYYTYDALGNVLTQTDANGNVTTYTYDALGREKRVNYADGTYETTTYTVNSDGTQVTMHYDGSEYITVTVVDKKDQTVLEGKAGVVVDSNNSTTTDNTYTYNDDTLIEYTRYTYDIMGNVTLTKNNTGVETTNIYNDMGWVTQSTTINGSLSTTTTNTYDDVGNALTKVTPEINTMSTYDKLNRPLTVTTSKNGSSSVTEYDYTQVYVVGSQSYKRTVMTDPLGRETTYEYDKSGNLVREIYGDRTTVYTYDANGNMLTSTLTDSNYSGQNEVTSYTYDKLNRKTRVTYSEDDQYVLYTYDNNGNVLTAALYENDTLSCTTTYTYDAMNRVTSVSRDGAIIAEYTYTDNGYLASIKYGSNDQVIGYEYDEAGKIIRISDITDSENPEVIREYFYVDGLLSYLVDARGTDDAKQEFAYDSLGRLISVKYYDIDDITVLEEYSIEYNDTTTNAKYQIETETTTTRYGGTVIVTEKAYTYDNLGRLTQESVTVTVNGGTPAVTTTSYTYDAVGNRLSMTSGGTILYYHYNGYDHLLCTDYDNNINTTTDIVTSYTYNLSGNQVTKTEGASTTTYYYDDANWLQYVTDDSNNTIANYDYDANGQRTQKTVGTSETHYFYTGIRLLYTTDSSDAIIEQNILETDGSMICSKRANGNYYWYRQDIRGSVTNIVEADDDIVKSYTYDAYGNTSSTGTFVNSFAYTGAVIDTETGLYYMNARYYEPETGRFINQDPYKGDGERFWHLYLYCNGDPVNYTDPTGHKLRYVDVSGESYDKNCLVRTYISDLWWFILNPGLVADMQYTELNLKFTYDYEKKYNDTKIPGRSIRIGRWRIYIPGYTKSTLVGKKLADVYSVVVSHRTGLAIFHQESAESTVYDKYVKIVVKGSFTPGISYNVEGGVLASGVKLTFTIYPWDNSKSKVKSERSN